MYGGCIYLRENHEKSTVHVDEYNMPMAGMGNESNPHESDPQKKKTIPELSSFLDRGSRS